jgi:predicted RNA-binding Zn-ribbon protein involved in translation (DUF1610 family)
MCLFGLVIGSRNITCAFCGQVISMWRSSVKMGCPKVGRALIRVRYAKGPSPKAGAPEKGARGRLKSFKKVSKVSKKFQKSFKKFSKKFEKHRWGPRSEGGEAGR